MAKSKAGRPQKYTSSDIPKICEAIKGSRGLYTIIADRLKCNVLTLKAALQKFPEAQAAFEAENSRVNEKVKTVVLDAIDEGDVQTAKWWLAKRCRSEFGDEAAKGADYDVEFVAEAIRGTIKAKASIRARQADAFGGIEFAAGGDDLPQED